MENQKKHFSIQLIDGIARFVFWFVASVSAIIVVLVTLHVLSIYPVGLNLKVDLPTNFRVLEEGTFKMGDSISVISISEASGKINFSNAPRGFTIYLALFILPLIAALLYQLWLFKGITKKVKQGKAFEPVNIIRLKRIAYVLVGSWFYLQLNVAIYNLFIVNKFAFESVKFSYTSGSFGGMLLFALFIWVLSHIFEKGAEIEEENRLTV